MKSIGKNSLYNMVCTIFDMIIQFLSSVYLARILLAEGVGQVAYAQNITSYFIAFAEFGITAYGIREIAQARECRSDVNRIFTELFLINAAVTTCSLFAYLIFGVLSEAIINQRALFYACGLSLIFHYLNIDWFYQGEEEYRYIVFRNLLVKIFSLGLIFLFVRAGEDYVKYALIMSLTGGCNCVLNVAWAHKSVKLVFKNLRLRIHIKKLFVLATGTFFITVYREISVTMLGVLSTNAETGCYSYAFTIIKMIISICTAAFAVFFPRLSYYYKADQDKFYNSLHLAMEVFLFVAFPAWAGVFILSPEIIFFLLGKTFLPAVGMMRILSILILIWCLSNVLGYQILLISGNEKICIPAYLTVILWTVILDYCLIPVLSGNGAAMIFVIGELGVNSYLIWKSRKLISFSVPWKALGQALVSTAVMGIGVYYVVSRNNASFIQCIVGIIIGGLLYGTVNYVLKNELMITILERIGKSIRN